jgi:D-alanyl-D-alanine carboxypeptidase
MEDIIFEMSRRLIWPVITKKGLKTGFTQSAGQIM